MHNVSAYIFLILSCSFWGLAFISSKVCLTWFDSYALTQYRFAVATVALFGLVLVTKSSLRVRWRDLIRIGFCGLFGIVIYYVLNNLSLTYVSASIAAIIGASIPLIAAILEVFIERRPPSLVTVASVVLSVAGVILLVGFQTNYDSTNLMFGVALALAASLAFVIYSFLMIPLQGKYPTSTVTFYQSLLSVIICLIFLPQNPVAWSEMGSAGWLNLLFLGIFSSAGCYVMYNFAVGRLPVVVCTLFINFIPIVAIIASAVLLGERLTLMQILGSGLVISSVVWLSLSKSAPTKKGQNKMSETRQELAERNKIQTSGDLSQVSDLTFLTANHYGRNQN